MSPDLVFDINQLYHEFGTFLFLEHFMFRKFLKFSVVTVFSFCSMPLMAGDNFLCETPNRFGCYGQCRDSCGGSFYCLANCYAVCDRDFWDKFDTCIARLEKDADAMEKRVDEALQTYVPSK